MFVLLLKDIVFPLLLSTFHLKVLCNERLGSHLTVQEYFKGINFTTKNESPQIRLKLCNDYYLKFFFCIWAKPTPVAVDRYSSSSPLPPPRCQALLLGLSID